MLLSDPLDDLTGEQRRVVRAKGRVGSNNNAFLLAELPDIRLRT